MLIGSRMMSIVLQTKCHDESSDFDLLLVDVSPAVILKQIRLIDKNATLIRSTASLTDVSCVFFVLVCFFFEKKIKFQFFIYLF